MSLVSFLGRALIASVFLYSAWLELIGFGDDGGEAAKSLRPKFNAFVSHVTTHTGQQLPPVDMKILVATAIALKGIGGVLFVFDSSFGAHLLFLHQVVAIPILYDFYNYDVDTKEYSQLFSEFLQNSALVGALALCMERKNRRRRQHQKKPPKVKVN
ncbi:hypothetical protein HA466_0001150 [Hirschfeldia incana]|nr:hypothetical protein HA466_0001150 [Hirschfeldia incana]